MTLMLVLFGAVLALVVLNVPIAVALGIVAVVAMVTSHGSGILPNLAIVAYNGATSFPLLAIPLFILAGAIMNASGISRRLIAFASSLFGWMRGGLAHVSIGASMFFAEISGSAVADIAALGSILIPAMKSKGYPAPLAAAVMSSAATLAVIIPPSIPMILYAVMAETSVVQLFVAGIVPGIIGGFGLMAMAYGFARRYDLPREHAFSLARVASAARDALWAFLLPIIILGGIFGGVVTATEGAALAVVASIVVGFFIYRELEVVLALLNLLFLLLGMFLHSAAAIILVVPVVMPLVKAVGIDPVHFGLIVTVNLGIGQQTPPVASVLMVASAISKASIWEVTRVNVWFIGVLVAVLLLVTYVPVTGMGLVELFYR